MRPAPRFKDFTRRLHRWYRRNHRDLPWRRTRDPYLIWISEVMLQQTTVSAVIPYFQGWRQAFPTVKALAGAPAQKVLRQWQGLGYYQRARNLHRAATVIRDEHGGRLPSDPEVLRRLPGFGPYTTAAVASIAFGRRTPVIDANVRRVVMRLLGIRGKAEARQDDRIMAFLQEVMPRRVAGTFNQAMMELGALVCRSKSPTCLACPVKTVCAAYARGTQEIIPEPRRTRIERVGAAIAVIERDGKFYIQQRPPRGLFADLWEFPGGKIKPGERPYEALAREVKEETGAEITAVKPLTRLRHYYTRFAVELHVFQCRLRGGLSRQVPGRWVRPAEMSQYPMPSGSARIVDILLQSK